MTRITRKIIAILAIALGIGSTASAQDSFVRFQRGETHKDAALQAAVSHLSSPETGVEIVLYGTVHVAEAEYYARVQRDLDSYDVVLYEGVAPGSKEPSAADRSLGELQIAMGEMLGLTFQKDGIDYTRSNLVHADMTIDQLKEALGGGSINPLGQFLSEEQLKDLAPFLRMAAGIGKKLLDGSPQLRETLKMQLAGQLGRADQEMIKGLGKQMYKAILIDRNRIVMNVLKKQLSKRDSGTIAIFYGAAHMPDFEQQLSDLGFRQKSKRWMTAWKMGRGVEEELQPAPSGPRWF